MNTNNKRIFVSFDTFAEMGFFFDDRRSNWEDKFQRQSWSEDNICQIDEWNSNILEILRNNSKEWRLNSSASEPRSITIQYLHDFLLILLHIQRSYELKSIICTMSNDRVSNTVYALNFAFRLPSFRRLFLCWHRVLRLNLYLATFNEPLRWNWWPELGWITFLSNARLTKSALWSVSRSDCCWI